MNNIIKQQLQKLRVARLPYYDDSTTEIIIKKSNFIVPQENKCYLIELGDDLLIPNNQSSLTINWNRGSIPKYKWYKVDVVKIMAHMIKVNGLAFDKPNDLDIDDIWSGWLPLKDINIIKEI